MKHPSTGLLIIIAIVTTSATIVNNTEFYKRITIKSESDCFNNMITTKSDCSQPESTIYLEGQTTCFAAPIVGHYLFGAISSSFYDYSGTSPDVCDGNNKFCCVTVYEDNNYHCSNEQLINLGRGKRFYRISSVYCQE